MARKKNLQRSVIERFTEATNPGIPRDAVVPETGGEPVKQQFRRFLRMVAARRQQILERMLMDEE